MCWNEVVNSHGPWGTHWQMVFFFFFGEAIGRCKMKERINFLKIIIIIIVGVGFWKSKSFFLQITFLLSCLVGLNLNLNGMLAYRCCCHYQLLYLSIYRLFVL